MKGSSFSSCGLLNCIMSLVIAEIVSRLLKDFDSKCLRSWRYSRPSQTNPSQAKQGRTTSNISTSHYQSFILEFPMLTLWFPWSPRFKFKRWEQETRFEWTSREHQHARWTERASRVERCHRGGEVRWDGTRWEARWRMEFVGVCSLNWPSK